MTKGNSAATGSSNGGGFSTSAHGIKYSVKAPHSSVSFELEDAAPQLAFHLSGNASFVGHNNAIKTEY